jgi:orotidine-5'-phosphate decarboxylase
VGILLKIIYGNVHHVITGRVLKQIQLAIECHSMIDPKMIIVALDYNNEEEVFKFVDNVDPNLCRIKIGKELFTKIGPRIIHKLHKKDFEIFLDLKFHDIPTTVYKACISAFSLNIWMLNIHLSGGYDMACAAMNAKKDCQSNSKLIGVTALTSLSDTDCERIYGCNRLDQIEKLKEIGLDANVDGFVCSAYDINTLKAANKIFVTPGIRIDNNTNDHHKVITPLEAIKLGSNYLVIGRSITESSNPNKTLEEIIKSL